ncbi:NAD(P)-binding protein [uncultured Tateyamaria sp.]|uniref:NAD(P)-binding protein n=1 Tax=uncultured Tateyamaria sp. TaxID=455651 RepID=UPI0026399F24|nr:NAD(P)-binding protein [uncultured Tateyamaria sp.]
MTQDHDHIVAGGGSAGCAVAARLAERPGARVRVLDGKAAASVRAPSPFHRYKRTDA